MPTTVETVFTAPGPQPNGMQATPGGLWILDQITNQVHFVSYTGAVMKTLETASDKGSGITDSGAALWLASTYSCEIIKIDRDTGATLGRWPSPGAAKTGSHGLEWRDGRLWIANPPTSSIYQVDVSAGKFEVIHTIPGPGNRVHGIAWDGDDLLCVETNHRAIYRLNPQTGEQLEKIEIPEPNPEPHGMTIWNGNFWYCDAHTRAVCRLPVRA
jgi:streptogramin lyase